MKDVDVEGIGSTTALLASPFICSQDKWQTFGRFTDTDAVVNFVVALTADDVTNTVGSIYPSGGAVLKNQDFDTNDDLKVSGWMPLLG